MSQPAVEATPSAYLISGTIPSAISFTDYESGLSVIRCATTQPFAPDMPDMGFDCSVATVGSRVAVGGILNTRTLGESKAAQAGNNIRLEGVQSRIEKLALALDSICHTTDKVRCLQVARFSLKVLYAGNLFGKFNMADDRYESDIISLLRAYQETMFDIEEKHPSLVLARAHLARRGLISA